MYLISPQVGKFERSWAYWDGAFSYAELKKLDALGTKLSLGTAVTGGATEGEALTDIRDSTVGWIKAEGDNLPLYEKFTGIVKEVNEKYFGFDLSGFVDDLQYTIYDANKGPQHYDWHIDSFGPGKPPRKLSFSVQISDSMDYEGGELWVHGYRREALPKVQGRVYFFPSFTLHRVTPVTKGIRTALVGWVSGPEFR